MNRQPYLTEQEYLDFGFKETDNFDWLLQRASDVLDSVTRFFYVHHSLEVDHTFRKIQFKKAVGCQIEYFHETGHVTTEGLNNVPQALHIGRTRITNPSPFNPSGSNEQKPRLCPDVYSYLTQTGLLNRGVR